MKKRILKLVAVVAVVALAFGNEVVINTTNTNDIGLNSIINKKANAYENLRQKKWNDILENCFLGRQEYCSDVIVVKPKE